MVLILASWVVFFLIPLPSLRETFCEFLEYLFNGIKNSTIDGDPLLAGSDVAVRDTLLLDNNILHTSQGITMNKEIFYYLFTIIY